MSPCVSSFPCFPIRVFHVFMRPKFPMFPISLCPHVSRFHVYMSPSCLHHASIMSPCLRVPLSPHLYVFLHACFKSPCVHVVMPLHAPYMSPCLPVCAPLCRVCPLRPVRSVCPCVMCVLRSARPVCSVFLSRASRVSCVRVSGVFHVFRVSLVSRVPVRPRTPRVPPSSVPIPHVSCSLFLRNAKYA